MSFSTSLPPIGPNPSGTYGNASASLPTANNDQTQGYSVGSLWLYTGGFPLPEILVCTSAATGAAVWQFTERRKMLGICSASIGIPPSGSFAANGALTITGNAFSTPVGSGYGAYLYFQANVIGAGVAAGFYWSVFADTTHATVYNNVYTAGDCAAPASPVAFPIAGPGAYTSPTGAFIPTLLVNLAGGVVGPRDTIIVDGSVLTANTAGTKSIIMSITGDAGNGSSFSSCISAGFKQSVVGKGASKQESIGGNGTIPYGGQSSGNIRYTTYDFTQAQSIGLQCQLVGTANDWILFDAATFELIRANS